MKEQDIQKKIIKYLESKGHYVVKVQVASKAGVPDILTCVGGVFVGIEVKTPKTENNVSKLQEYNIKKIKESGGIAFVATSIEDVDNFLFDTISLSTLEDEIGLEKGEGYGNK